jgi:hypothetical protein
MKQRTLAMMTGFERYSKKTRRTDGVFGGVGAGGAVVGVMCAGGTVLSKGGAGATAGGSGANAADVFCAVMVQSG